MRLLKLALAPIAAVAMAFSMSASADTKTWMLDVWGGSGDPGTGPWGTVVATTNGFNEIDVTVTLIPPSIGFVNTGNHTPFAFSLSDTATAVVTVSAESLAKGFSVGSPPPFPNPSFGSFTNGIVCSGSDSPTGCGNGGNSPNPGPLSFSIVDTTFNSLNPIGFGIFVNSTGGSLFSPFAADILTNGATGAIGTSNTPAIPEPETYAMMLVGFGLLGFVARRRRQNLVNTVLA